MYVEFEQINKGCPGECKSQVIATASEGFPPYQYFWNAQVAPNDSSLALGLCSEDTYTLLVKDTLCLYDTTYEVEAYDLPEIELTVSPDTVYRTNPKAEFYFENKSDTISLTNWFWIYPDSTTTDDEVGSFVFQESDSVQFVYTTDDGCVDTTEISVTLKEFEMEIPNVFTPNGDGANEVWEVPDLEKYISNEVIIFNRWGDKVFEASNYQNNWDGGRLGDGVYFYILKCDGYWQQDVYKGSVTIIGSKY
jgi:gliding motility-associated-like protein